MADDVITAVEVDVTDVWTMEEAAVTEEIPGGTEEKRDGFAAVTVEAIDEEGVGGCDGSDLQLVLIVLILHNKTQLVPNRIPTPCMSSFLDAIFLPKI